METFSIGNLTVFFNAFLKKSVYFKLYIFKHACNKKISMMQDTSTLQKHTKIDSNAPKDKDGWIETDKKSFLFSLKATHREGNQAIKFEMKNSARGNKGYAESDCQLISLGGNAICLWKQNKKEESYYLCCRKEDKNEMWCKDKDDNLLEINYDTYFSKLLTYVYNLSISNSVNSEFTIFSPNMLM